MFQQATRTRNIQTLYFYSEADEPIEKQKEEQIPVKLNTIVLTN